MSVWRPPEQNPSPSLATPAISAEIGCPVPPPGRPKPFVADRTVHAALRGERKPRPSTLTGTAFDDPHLAMTAYSFRLDGSELQRYQAMAARALDSEASFWDAGGIGPGARVVDLGCGPGTFLPALAARTAPNGRVTGIDRAADAVAAARALVDKLALERVDVQQAGCEVTRIDTASVDTVLMRNVLVHNGRAVPAILAHVRSLLRPGGHLLVAEPDLAKLEFPDHVIDERELEQRWIAWARSVGNDPSLGARLAAIVASAGFGVEASTSRIDVLRVERSPAWTARHVLVEAGFATDSDVQRWDNAIANRLTMTGSLEVGLPLHVVLARRPHPQGADGGAT